MTITEYLTENFPEVEPKQFYRMMFPEGELDKAGAITPGQYTGIVTRITGRKEHGKTKVYRYTLTDELDAVDIATGCDDFCICRPLSYAGKQATAERARFCYAIAIDVDKLRTDRDGERPLGLINLWERHILKLERIPQPTAIVSSGTGIHLYYFLEKPIPLYRDQVFELQELKRELTRVIWHDTIVNISSVLDVQQEGIYQGFRMPGTVTKNGGRARAFMTGNRVTVEYLNSFVSESFKAKKTARNEKTKLTLAEAREKYPEWYKNRIENEKKPGTWAVNRRLYEWWKRQIREGASVGHRYYCVMILSMYAQKCSHYDEKKNPHPVTREELEKDCFELLEFLDAMTETEDNHFDEGDILDALEAFDSRWTRYPRQAIEYRSGITIPANKRNGRKQAEHVKLMNLIRDQINKNTEWNRQGNGRKSKASVVQDWRMEHPEGTKAECIRETGLSKPTVLKWWEL